MKADCRKKDRTDIAERLERKKGTENADAG